MIKNKYLRWTAASLIGSALMMAIGIFLTGMTLFRSGIMGYIWIRKISGETITAGTDFVWYKPVIIFLVTAFIIWIIVLLMEKKWFEKHNIKVKSPIGSFFVTFISIAIFMAYMVLTARYWMGHPLYGPNFFWYYVVLIGVFPLLTTAYLTYKKKRKSKHKK